MEYDKLKKLVNDIVNEGESEVIEFKENNFREIEIGKKISALSNSANLLDQKNAYFIFGVSDDNKIVGTSFSLKKQKVGNELLESWLCQMLSPKIDFNIFEFQIDSKNIVVCQIPPAIIQPVKFQNTAYVRIGSITRKLTDFPEKERKIWQNIDKKSSGKGIAIENLTVSEILDLLEYSKFPTLKRKSVRVVIYKGDTRVDILKNQEGVFGYAVSFESLIDFINDKLPSNEEITKTLREEKKMYPEIAIREFVANALIHQDFTISGAGPMIEIFDNRIEITNTGIPLIDTERFIDHAPISRNEDLANFMRQIRFCEELGSGIDRALFEISVFQLPAPKFEVGDNFTRVTLYAYKKLNDMSLEDKIRACYQHAVLKWIENKRMTNESLRERFGIEKQNYSTASRIISETLKKGKIKESEKAKEYLPYWA